MARVNNIKGLARLPKLSDIGNGRFEIFNFLFALFVRRREGIPWGKAIGAYALIAIMSGLGYGLFALVYLVLMGGLW